MNHFIFNVIAKSLVKIGQLTGLTYNEVNVIVYYFLIPFSWLCLIDLIFDFHYFKAAFVIFTSGFFVGCENFRSYSDRLFMRSVKFLNYFNRFGSTYIASSVWICVALPLVIYILLIYLVLK